MEETNAPLPHGRHCIAAGDGGHSSLLLIASGVKDEDGPSLMSAGEAAVTHVQALRLHIQIYMCVCVCVWRFTFHGVQCLAAKIQICAVLTMSCSGKCE